MRYLIKEERQLAGITQKTLAQRAGLNVQTLKRLESGKTTPKPATLAKIAGALDIPVRSLIAREQPQTVTLQFKDVPVGMLGMIQSKEFTTE
jgi:transcriptional regulator with XRE-family HTH domain